MREVIVIGHLKHSSVFPMLHAHGIETVIVVDNRSRSGRELLDEYLMIAVQKIEMYEIPVIDLPPDPGTGHNHHTNRFVNQRAMVSLRDSMNRTRTQQLARARRLPRNKN